MVCDKCNAKLPEGAFFCTQCGNKIEPTIKEQKQKSIKKIDKEEKQARKIKEKELKKAAKDVLTTTKELLDFVDTDERERIITRTGAINIFKIETKDIYSFSETERKINIYNFIYFIRGFHEDFKIITMKFPVSTTKQQEYVTKKINKCTNEVYKVFLKEKLEELRYLEEHRFNKEFYLMTFYKKDDDIDQLEKKFVSRSNLGVNLSRLDIDKKIKIIHKLNNMNSKLF